MNARMVFLVTTMALRAAAAQQATGTWQATAGVAYPPWTIDLKQNGTAVTGNVRQNGGVRGPVDIVDGRVQGNTITFKVPGPSGTITLTFVGTFGGDSIAFRRSVEGRGGGNGLFGAGGASAFTVRRADAAAAAAALAAPVPVARGALAAAPAVRNPPTAPTADPTWLQFRGFSVDLAAITNLPNRVAIIDGVRTQLTLVDTTRLTTAVKAFFKTIPMTMNASPTGSPAYGNDRVVLPAQLYEPEKPVLLHELMHAYHEHRVNDGFRNTEIQRMFEAARTGGLFPAGSYMLTNPAEYFAMMASVYVFGSAARDPFTRDGIGTKQPEMYRWLVKEFGSMR